MKGFRFSLAFLVSLTLFSLTQYTFADDGAWGSDEDPLIVDWIGDSAELDLEHVDADPWKGWATLSLKNSCGEDWGDFHIKIKGLCTDVNIRDDHPYEPQLLIKEGYSYEQYTGLTWEIHNGGSGATIDLYFYDNPIGHNEKAIIKIYTDNTTWHHTSFHVTGYPTPVPEPSSLALVAIGGLVLARFASRRGRK